MTTLAARKNRTALYAAGFVAFMLALAFASVPLYRMFCQATGFEGTTQRAKRAPGADLAAGMMQVRFDANVAPNLPWKFEPEQATVEIRPGARTLIYYRAKNLAARAITGQAAYNVSPDQSGIYFNKIQCFCFNEQTLAAGQEVRMPVVFYVDPKIRTDETTRDVHEITLSYTFYPVEKSGASG
ncbi:cytochrome c oxidase assembly protein [Sphingomonas ginkgonis]|uniref:Cytochrome c oxidase assembly protein CtaG n=1 Tax=Sphingomonas ginkgonis TaxID=2315330 RepID=A0A3R9YGS0_9SPHN|nr:cytochrome c oxidase assembly protein [Sphingomonas ginkgonis]RST29571.1 cytochrome c oxidase assembly protein [Sphingomonas ginkgonis]